VPGCVLAGHFLFEAQRTLLRSALVIIRHLDKHGFRTGSLRNLSLRPTLPRQFPQAISLCHTI
jgi:hypothetical protein